MTDDIDVDVESDEGIAVNVGMGGLLPGEREKLNGIEAGATRFKDGMRVITTVNGSDWAVWSRVGSSSYKPIALTLVSAEAMSQGYIDFFLTADIANVGGDGNETVSFQLMVRNDRPSTPADFISLGANSFGLPQAFSAIATFTSSAIAASTSGRMVLRGRLAFEANNGSNFTQTGHFTIVQDDNGGTVLSKHFLPTTTINPGYAFELGMQFKFSEAPAGGQKANVTSYVVSLVGERNAYAAGG